MALATFYHQQLTSTDHQVKLSAAESAHAIKSRRLAIGSAIQIINGRGLLAQANILEINKRSCLVNIHSIEERPLSHSLIVATAIPKGDRQRTMIDMLTQIGVTKVIPLKCERSVTKYKDTVREKWQRYAVEACKQSQNLWLPTITAEQNIIELVDELDFKAIFADSDGQDILTLRESLHSDLTVLVGPEGGFSTQETEVLSNTCIPVNLGINILRTELACVVAAAHMQLIYS